MHFDQLKKSIYNKAVQFLARRNYSSYELKQKLLIYCHKKTFPENVSIPDFNDLPLELISQIELVVDSFIQKNWIDDVSYINQYCQIKANKGYGKKEFYMI